MISWHSPHPHPSSLTGVRLRYIRRAIRLNIAGKLLRLTFWISPQLQKSYNEVIIQNFETEMWPFSD